MWTAAVFAGIALVGIVFLLWFLSHLLQERPLRRRGLDRRQPAEAARYGLRLRSEWAAIKREEQAVTLHSVLAIQGDSCPRDRKRRAFMADIVFILVTVLFFAISIAYTYFCERMR